MAGFLAASHLEASASAPLAVLQSTVRVSVPVDPQADVEQGSQDEECQLNVAHAGVEHAVDVTSLVATLHLEAAATAPLAVLHSTIRVWVPVEPQVVVEQAPQEEGCHPYVSHAGVEHDADVVGFLATLHLEVRAKAPLDVLQSMMRVRVPVEPQVDTEQALHDDECHLYVSHARVEHTDDVVGFLAASHLYLEAKVPVEDLQSTFRI